MVAATHVANFDAAKNPGDYFITPPNPAEGGMRRLSFLCPCGCGELCGIRIHDDGQQVDGVWAWNLDADKPTCTPSIDVKDGKGGSHWHGYLTAGQFIEC